MLLAGWALAQYPYLVVPDLTFENAAASPAMMRAALVIFGIGALPDPLPLVPLLRLQGGSSRRGRCRHEASSEQDAGDPPIFRSEQQRDGLGVDSQPVFTPYYVVDYAGVMF